MAERKQAAGRFAVFFSGHGCPVVTGLCAWRGEAGWIDGTAAGPTQL